jgi:hypothetical protein
MSDALLVSIAVARLEIGTDSDTIVVVVVDMMNVVYTTANS